MTSVGSASDVALEFHHFGLAVQTPDEAFNYLEALGYQPGAQEFDPLQRVCVAMRHHPRMPDVEVIWPRDRPSPIDALIKGGGSRIYHLCYASREPYEALTALTRKGLAVMQVVEPRPAVLFGGLPVSFHMVSGIGLIELIHGQP